MLTPEQIAQLRRFMEVRQERDETDLAAKKAKAAYQEAELDLFEDLDGPMSRLSNVDLGVPWGVVSFRRRETYFGKIIPGMEEKVLEYYENRGMIDSMTQPRFNKKRLNEQVRKVVEDGGVGMPPGVDYYANRGVTVTRQKT